LKLAEAAVGASGHLDNVPDSVDGLELWAVRAAPCRFSGKSVNARLFARTQPPEQADFQIIGASDALHGNTSHNEVMRTALL
jgi:hypothetical protein